MELLWGLNEILHACGLFSISPPNTLCNPLPCLVCTPWDWPTSTILMGSLVSWFLIESNQWHIWDRDLRDIYYPGSLPPGWPQAGCIPQWKVTAAIKMPPPCNSLFPEPSDCSLPLLLQVKSGKSLTATTPWNTALSRVVSLYPSPFVEIDLIISFTFFLLELV